MESNAVRLTVCTLFVPRGEEPLYFLDGVIYLRKRGRSSA
jgi:hypothetical protein